MFGLGGIYTEALKDVTFRAAPLSSSEAGEMLRDIRAANLLGNFRGMPAADTCALTDILQQLSFISLIHPEISEIDINPIILEGANPVAVDALIILSK